MTCAESILAGRPLVTSAVCPALDYLREASVEAKPDDPRSYQEAIVNLRDNKQLYETKQRASAGLQQQFYDRTNSWYAAMLRAIKHHVLKG
jgi:glycosyltransferase involved in cell wall biosynthesis